MIKNLFSKKHIKIFMAIYIFVMAFCVIIGVINKNKIVYSNDDNIIIQDYKQDIIIADGISLNPGIYRAEIDFDMDTDLLYGGFLYIQDETVRARGLESTGGPIYQGRNNATAEFILKDHTDSLKLISTVYEDECSINSVRIIDTGKMWFVAATKITAVFLVVLIIAYYFELLSLGSISREKNVVIFIMLGVLLFMILPSLYQNTISSGDDGYHKQRIEGIATAIRSLQIPVRIEPHWLQGYGYANAIFYCDLFLTIPAIFRLIGFSVTDSYNIYLALVNAAILLVSYYSFKRIYKKEYIALTLCILYSTTILRFYRLIGVGVIGEGTAIVFFPLILLGIYEIFYKDEEEKNSNIHTLSFLPLGLGIAGIIHCHILSTEMMVGVMLFILVLNNLKLFKKKTILSLLFSAITCTVLSLWFVVPFIEYYLFEDVHIKHVYARTIQEWGLYFPQLLRLFVDVMGDGDSFSKGMYHCSASGLSFLSIIFILAFIILWTTGCLKEKKNKYRFEKHALIITIVFILFSLKLFPWDFIQSRGGILEALVSSIQYPVRFLEIASIFAVPVIAGVILYFERIDEKKTKWIVFIVTGISFVFSSIYYSDAVMTTTGKYYIANAEGIGTGYIAGGEYKPEGTDENLLIYNKTSCSDNVVISDYISGNLRGTIHVKNESDAEGYVEYPLINYRGYRAYDSLGNQFDICNGENNVIRVIVPSNYSGDITVRFVSPWYWRLSELISLLGFATLMIYLMYKKRENDYSKDQERLSDTEISSSTNYVKAIRVFCFVFTVVMTTSPLLTGYVTDGKYINETLYPFERLSGIIGVNKVTIYIATILIIAIVAYILIRMFIKRLSLMIGLRDEGLEFISNLIAMTYMLSPVSIYFLYYLFAPFAWMAVLMIPAIMSEGIMLIHIFKKKERKISIEDVQSIIPLALAILGIIVSLHLEGYKELTRSLNISHLILLFPRKGSFITGGYLSVPLGISFSIISVGVMTLTIIICKRIINSETNTNRNGLVCSIIILISTGLYIFGCIPNLFTSIPFPLIRFLGPLTILSLAEAIGVIALPYFIYFMAERIKNETYRFIVIFILAVTALIPAIFHLNSIAYESVALWM